MRVIVGHNQSSQYGIVRWEWGEKIAAAGIVAGRGMAVGRKKESAMVSMNYETSVA